MKIWIYILLCAGSLLLAPKRSQGQAAELAQLALNIEKLAQLKSILSNMYNGYKILTEGYDRVKSIANSNYKLHQAFLDGLYMVSPAVRKYKRVGDIVTYQARLINEYRQAFGLFKSADVFGAADLTYMEAVYSNLLNESAGNLEELFMVVTAGEARMSDNERLAAIDRIFIQMESKLIFLRQFNTSTRMYAMQKMKEKNNVQSLRTLYGEK